MTSKLFRFHPEARQDFRESIVWYRSQSARVAVEFRVTVSDSIRQILQAPQQYPKYLFGTRRLVLRRFPFSIIYLDDLGGISIVAVAHGKRKPGYWKQRI